MFFEEVDGNWNVETCVYVDEVHLFVHNGLSFWSKFVMLSLGLFRHLIIEKGDGL